MVQQARTKKRSQVGSGAPADSGDTEGPSGNDECSPHAHTWREDKQRSSLLSFRTRHGSCSYYVFTQLPRPAREGGIVYNFELKHRIELLVRHPPSHPPDLYPWNGWVRSTPMPLLQRQCPPGENGRRGRACWVVTLGTHDGWWGGAAEGIVKACTDAPHRRGSDGMEAGAHAAVPAACRPRRIP